MIRSLVQYTSFFASGLADARLRALMRAHAAGAVPVQEDLSSLLPQALTDVAGHLCRAQDSGVDRGLGSFHLVYGWGASYPETTGYIVPTLLALSDRLGREDLRLRALEAADWLVSIQRTDGGWQGGRVGEDRPSVVFNTAQVVRGLLAAHDTAGGSRYHEAAARACDWMVRVQESDGSWAGHNFLGSRRVYDTYVSAPLLHMAERTGRPAYREAALKNLAWVLTRQRLNGWFADADNTVKHNDRPITHTIAYTIDGLLECFAYTADERLLEAARRPAEALLGTFERNGSLNGRYDAHWQGSEAAITTGCAQLAIVWARLHRITGDPRWQEGCVRMVRWLAAVQRLSVQGPAPMQGAVTGSFPLWGRYEKFACPNWAQKYLADALLCAEGRTPRY
ncbi:MAG TPA: terpene cyclase/mutase family protein [Flavobacteriales bacterium]|nr:terpene cyclase/mutase family protein [Flavobacteriales bacterium]